MKSLMRMMGSRCRSAWLDSDLSLCNSLETLSFFFNFSHNRWRRAFSNALGACLWATASGMHVTPPLPPLVYNRHLTDVQRHSWDGSLIPFCLLRWLCSTKVTSQSKCLLTALFFCVYSRYE